MARYLGECGVNTGKKADCAKKGLWELAFVLTFMANLNSIKEVGFRSLEVSLEKRKKIRKMKVFD